MRIFPRLSPSPGSTIRLRTDAIVIPIAWVMELGAWSTHGPTHLRWGGVAPPWFVPVCTAGLFATLLFRRRFPFYVLAGQIAWALTTSLIMPTYNAFAGVLVGLHAYATRRPPARSVAALLVCMVPFVIQAYNADQTLKGEAVNMAVAGVTATAAWALGYRNWLSDTRVAQQQERSVALTAQALRTERLRIARELHDIVAHSVSVMVLQAAGARAVLSTRPKDAGQALDVIQEIGSQSMGELRRLLGLLRSASEREDDSGALRSIDDVQALVETSRAAGLTVSVQVEGSPGRLDPSVSLTVYRLVQEAMTNTMKHAGVDAEVHVQMAWGSQELSVTVQDHCPPGRQPAPSAGPLSTGHGLIGLRERVVTVGGSLHTDPTPDGFRIHAVLPVAQPSIRIPTDDQSEKTTDPTTRPFHAS